MQLRNPTADFYMPAGPVNAGGIQKSDRLHAVRKTTHLAIGSHPDDLEIMAYHGIAQCYRQKQKWFGGIVVTNGAGSPRSGKYANYSDEEIIQIRRDEQRRAAEIGDYSFVAQLGYSSSQVKTKLPQDLAFDLRAILEQTKLETLYLHNPADLHDTHVAVFLHSLEVLRSLPLQNHPKNVYACEVWRDLDWAPTQDRVALDVSFDPKLAQSLCTVFDSQISGGKKYDLGTMGRRVGHATFSESHEVDTASAVTYALDCTSLLQDTKKSAEKFVEEIVERFRSDVLQRLRKFG